ncbi:MAG: hypothetical protein RIC03_06855 [Cyclobacteriaceae bacterium]
MKTLGVKQFHQKTFKLLNLKGSPFAGILGKVTKYFILVIYGFSGNGKTEFAVKLAKALAQLGLKVAWLSYEQGHGFDLQLATKRNNMEEVNGFFYPIDPTEKKAANVSYLEDLDNYLKKRNSPDVVFIDSLDYTGFKWEDYIFLKEKYAHKKTLIFIAHSSKTGRLIKRISEQIIFDGGMGFFVSKYIAHVDKNRYGGFDPFIIWEEKARELNPVFFAKQLKESTPKKTKTKKAKK